MDTHNNSQKHCKNPSRTPSPILRTSGKSMNRIKFTDLSIKNIKLPDKRKIFWCQGIAGFGLRLSPSGVKTWIYMYDFEGKSRMMSLGRYPKIPLSEAKVEYSKSAHQVKLGIDPCAEKLNQKRNEQESDSIEILCLKYIQYCKLKGEKSWKEKERALKKEIVSIIGKRKVHHITFKDIAIIINNIFVERNAPVQATRVLSHTRCMFKYAKINLGLIENNPCADLEAPKVKKKPKHALSTKDIYLFWNNMDYTLMTPVIRLGLKFMLCTLSRGIEVRNMKWSHVNFDDETWFIPSENAKNGKEILLPLNKFALSILREIKDFTGHSDFVFGWNRSLNSGQQILDSQELTPMAKDAFSHALRDNFDLLNIETKFTPHDLRRTAATCLTSIGYSREWVGKLLNHTPNNVTSMVYDVFDYYEEKKAGMKAIDYILYKILSAKTIDMVPSLRSLRKDFISHGLIHRFLQEGYLGSENQPEYKNQYSQANSSSPVSYKLSYDLDR